MNGEDPTILVVDDEPALRDIFSGWVESLSCGRVLTADDGVKALHLLDENNVVLLVTDVRMPGMDGVTLVRQTANRTKIPSIIFVSAYTDVDEREMYSLGAEAFIGKPLRKEDLTIAVMKALTERSKLWRSPPARPARQTIQCLGELDRNELALGRGGFCMRHGGNLALGAVDFHCPRAGDVPLNGSGIVRWRSRSEGLIGVEFIYLDDDCRESVVKQIHGMKLVSYIPRDLGSMSV